MKLGILSDAHGNATALTACLAELRAREVHDIYFLGDAVGYMPGERRVLELLQDAGAICVQGNHEAMLLGRLPLPAEKDAVYQLSAARSRLSREEVARIDSWPEMRRRELEGKNLWFVHGAPDNPLEGRMYPDGDFSRMSGLGCDTIFVGHTHYPFVRHVRDTQVVNVGSCGLPRDQGSLPAFAVYDSHTGVADLFRVRVDAEHVFRSFDSAYVAPDVVACLKREPTHQVVGQLLKGENSWNQLLS